MIDIDIDIGMDSDMSMGIGIGMGMCLHMDIGVAVYIALVIAIDCARSAPTSFVSANISVLGLVKRQQLCHCHSLRGWRRRSASMAVPMAVA